MPPQRLARPSDTETPIDDMDALSREMYLRDQRRAVTEIAMNGSPEDTALLEKLEHNPQVHPAVREIIRDVLVSIEAGIIPLEARTRTSSSLNLANRGDGNRQSRNDAVTLDERR